MLKKISFNDKMQPICLPLSDSMLIKGEGTVLGWGNYNGFFFALAFLDKSMKSSP